MDLSIFDQAISFVRAGFSIIPLHYPVELENGFICSCGDRDCRCAHSDDCVQSFRSIATTRSDRLRPV